MLAENAMVYIDRMLLAVRLSCGNTSSDVAPRTHNHHISCDASPVYSEPNKHTHFILPKTEILKIDPSQHDIPRIWPLITEAFVLSACFSEAPQNYWATMQLFFVLFLTHLPTVCSHTTSLLSHTPPKRAVFFGGLGGVYERRGHLQAIDKWARNQTKTRCLVVNGW